MTSAEEWGEIYKKDFPKYSDFTNKLKDLLNNILQDIDLAQLESRTKNVDSFIEKNKQIGKRL